MSWQAYVFFLALLCIFCLQKTSEKLRVIDHKVYTYLYRHDKEWLNKNRPKVKNVGKKEVDWEERDNNLLLEVKAAYKKIMEKEKPTRITIYSIRREIERPNYLSKKTLNKLPKTREYLNNIIETVPEFQIRRVHYAFEILQKENKTITEYALKKAAQLPTHCDQTVQDEINKILSYHI
ncbi:TnsD family Tn7-like transposition protein [Geobacillus thermodenitrificans]|uniref:TnsD family Tn7-like transposition protein n=1 Tax=Geobacillus thermodenitrificans TaxID=33940 RepID=UPI0034C6BBFE